jgi:hypothetical protein
MKRRTPKAKPLAVTETYGGDYHRLESTFRLPDRFRTHAKPTGSRQTPAKPGRPASRAK